jgi:1,4-alpha-glucan branching enzyme
MAAVDFVFLLHSHMPYVRRNGDWPCGEEWILEAWAESYLPIWELVEDLTAGALPGKLSLTMTPVLAEQLRDDYLQERLKGYLENRIRQAQDEVKRLEGMGDEPRARLASLFGERYGELLRDFEERYRGRMLEVLKKGMDGGRVEVLASAATHAHLPSLGTEACRLAQVEIGLDCYRRYFQRDPAGFWLPECSYTPALDRVLDRFSPPLRYVVLDHNAPETAPEEACSWEPRRLGSTRLLALMRDEVAHQLVWTMPGLPSHPPYREYSKRDYDGYGFQYWRITSRDTPLDEKDIYHPEAADGQALNDARDFAASLRRRREEILSGMGNGGETAVILAAYDTELLGHWWLEGPRWLRETLRLLGDETELPGHLAGKALAGEPPAFSPRLTAWNVENGFATWVNPATADVWDRTHRSEKHFLNRLRSQPGEDPEAERALAQAARELLLMEASDWTYMIGRDEAAGYARERFDAHLERYTALLNMLDRKEIDRGALSSLEGTDNLFSWLDRHYWK